MPLYPPAIAAGLRRFAAFCLCAFGALSAAGADGVDERVADTKFSVDRGFYSAPLLLEIRSDTGGAVIRYTLDGSRPTPERGHTYRKPLPITGTSVVRAAAFKEGLEPTDVDSQTYLFPADVVRQTGEGRPPHWGALGEFDTEPGNLPPGLYAADYAMDPDIVDHPEYAATILDDLRSIPTLSVSLHPEDLFSDTPVATDLDGQVTETRGIYPIGKGFERAASAEFILPDGSGGFQIDCSIEIQGATSTDRWKTDKLSMRLKFKAPYGPSELDYPLFGDDASDSINTVILDATNQQAWTHPDPAQQLRAQYIRDQFVGDLQNAAGGIAPHGRYAHVYLNGLYWGVYWLHEFVEEGFVTAYRGGDDSDYDILRHRADNVVTGDADGFAALLAATAADLAQLGNYQAVADLLDIEAFADYMLINFYAGNADWSFQNWNASAHRSDPARKWLFHNWDAEKTFQFVLDDSTSFDNPDSPTAIHQRLRASPEYRLAFADRVRAHCSNGGILTPATATAMYLERLGQIDRAVVAESARWGDNRNPESPPYTRATWLAERDRLINEWFPARTAVLLGQLEAGDLYPATPAPEFSQFGGDVAAGFVLVLTDPGDDGQIFYTTDGSDPRQAGGAPGATAMAGGSLSIDASTRVRARTRSSSGDWSALTEAVFLVSSDLGALRVSELMFNPASPGTAEEELGFDDADLFEFVELLNTGGTAVQLEGVQFDAGVNFRFGAHSLPPGERVLVVNDLAAFEQRYGIGMYPVAGEYGGTLSNAGETVSLRGPFDEPLGSFTFNDKWYPATDGDGQSLVVVDENADPDELDSGAAWRASTFVGGSPGEAEPPLPALRITELHYHPREPGGAEELEGFTSESEFEFVEVRNIGSTALPLAGYALSGAVDFTFGAATLPPGARALVVASETAMAVRYGGELPIVGVFSDGQLGNGGERLVLTGSGGEVIHDFEYDDAWHPASDGPGASLVVVDDGAAVGDWGVAGQWRASAYTGGSPGREEPVPSSSTLRITEVMYNPGAPSAEEIDGGFDDNNAFEYIEVTNIGETSIDLEGYGLVEGVSFQFPEVSLGPQQRLVIVKDEDAYEERYGSDAAVLGEYGGNLKNDGETVVLEDPAGDVILNFRYADDWYDSTDGAGRSLTIVDRFAHRVYWGDEGGWRPSGAVGGSPGQAPEPYAAWAWSEFGGDAFDDAVAREGADPDGDGTVNALEYALGSGPLDAAERGYFESVIALDGELYLALSFGVNPGAGDVAYAVEFSSDGWRWVAADLGAQTVIEDTDTSGRPRLTVIDPLPFAGGARMARLRVDR